MKQPPLFHSIYGPERVVVVGEVEWMMKKGDGVCVRGIMSSRGLYLLGVEWWLGALGARGPTLVWSTIP
jgi:hypothetical protein